MVTTGGQMSGKTVLVTGATNGIGRVAARELVGQGARVYIIGRNAEKTAATAAEIGATGMIIADLSEQAEVRRAAQEFRDREGQLDVLLNNAGGVFQQRQETREGIEMTWALNHLAYFLLTQELLPLLHAASAARIVNVSSSANSTGKMRWDDLEFRHGYSSFAAYSQSKLANILFTRELSRRLAGSDVTANALHPGFVASGFGQNNSKMMSRVLGLMQVFAKTEEQGAQTSVYLASSPLVQGVTGRYFDNEHEAKPSPRALDDAAAARLWEVSEVYVRENMFAGSRVM